MNSGSLTRLYNFSSQILDHFGSIADPSGCTVYFQGLYLSGSVYLISDHFDPYLALFFTFTFLWSNLLCLYSTLAAAILQSWIHFCIICSIFSLCWTWDPIFDHLLSIHALFTCTNLVHFLTFCAKNVSFSYSSAFNYFCPFELIKLLMFFVPF